MKTIRLFKLSKEKSERLTLIAIIFILGFCIVMLFREHSVQKRYGFLLATPMMRTLPCKIEPIMITHLDKGEAFDKAGFAVGDIIVKEGYFSVGGFIETLKKPSGDTVYIKVIPADVFESDCDHIVTFPTEIRKVIVPAKDS